STVLGSPVFVGDWKLNWASTPCQAVASRWAVPSTSIRHDCGVGEPTQPIDSASWAEARSDGSTWTLSTRTWKVTSRSVNEPWPIRVVRHCTVPRTVPPDVRSVAVQLLIWHQAYRFFVHPSGVCDTGLPWHWPSVMTSYTYASGFAEIDCCTTGGPLWAY